MGTRADFYVGRGPDAEWLGSIAWDGNPAGICTDTRALEAGDEQTFRDLLGGFLASRGDATTPDQGWPWPWNDSRTTDYAYAFDSGRVYGSCCGQPWFLVDPKGVDFGEPDEGEEIGESAVFPDMSARQAVTFGERSGVIIFGGGQ
ncbi:hypothetical protein AB0395_26430 [Streptosporangium sp. NPDC051023]|uniref:hypothetical protein n=1 Tax=Streptosporangium sp. NPDC051023 TaxID=3155410 RepID=UPI00344CB4A5